MVNSKIVSREERSAKTEGADTQSAEPSVREDKTIVWSVLSNRWLKLIGYVGSITAAFVAIGYASRVIAYGWSGLPVIWATSAVPVDVAVSAAMATLQVVVAALVIYIVANGFWGGDVPKQTPLGTLRAIFGMLPLIRDSARITLGAFGVLMFALRHRSYLRPKLALSQTLRSAWLTIATTVEFVIEALVVTLIVILSLVVVPWMYGVTWGVSMYALIAIGKRRDALKQYLVVICALMVATVTVYPPLPPIAQITVSNTSVPDGEYAVMGHADGVWYLWSCVNSSAKIALTDSSVASVVYVARPAAPQEPSLWGVIINRQPIHIGIISCAH